MTVSTIDNLYNNALHNAECCYGELSALVSWQNGLFFHRPLIGRHDILHINTQLNDSEHKGLEYDTRHKWQWTQLTPSITMLRIMWSVVALNVAFFLLLCWVSLYWMSLCWMPLCWIPLSLVSWRHLLNLIKCFWLKSVIFLKKVTIESTVTACTRNRGWRILFWCLFLIQFCQTKGGYLAAIDTKERQDLIKTLIKQHFEKFSTGNVGTANFLVGKNRFGAMTFI